MSRHTKPNITHVRTAEADTLAVKEAYLLNRGWQSIEQLKCILWWHPEFTDTEKQPIPMADAILRQDEQDQRQKVNKAAKMEDTDAS